MTQFASRFELWSSLAISKISDLTKKRNGSLIGLIYQAAGEAKVWIIDPLQIAYLGTEFDTFILCNKF